MRVTQSHNNYYYLLTIMHRVTLSLLKLIKQTLFDAVKLLQNTFSKQEFHFLLCIDKCSVEL